MAAVTGPIRSLPGTIFSAKANTTCDDHDDRPAVKRIQGDTDSFGSEMLDVCQECYDAYIKVRDDETNKVAMNCERCGKESFDCKPTRDPGESATGPVYYWCSSCVSGAIKSFLDDDLDY